MKAKSINLFQLTLGAMYAAMFALAGNLPVLSGIQIIPGVAITLQTFLIAMMGLTLGVRGGMTSYIAVLLLTFCGLPMMSGGKGGPMVFVGPTSGYIYGWVFIIVLLGAYSSRWMSKLVQKKAKGMSIHLPVSFLIGMAGILLDYACGSLGLIFTGKAQNAFWAVFIGNFGFLPGDMIKIGLASVMSLLLFAHPVYARILRVNHINA